MTPHTPPNTRLDREHLDREHMEKYNIRKVVEDHFYVDGFHYTNLSDALAQAQRGVPQGPDTIVPQAGADESDALARLGIERRKRDRYVYGSYRYATLRDAIAQAKRSPR